MGDLQAIQRFLTRDPVLQAMLEAETCAIEPAQLKLLDAVLMDDHRRVRQLLEDEEHTHLLSDQFFLALSIVMVGKSDPEVLMAFHHHGYGAATKPAMRGTASDLRMGDIALWVCPVERQKALVEAGFLSVKNHAYAGMGNVDPEMFDLWSELYFAQEATQARAPVPGNAPIAGLTLFRWLPETKRRNATPVSQATRQECSRRLDRMIDGFLDLHYPGSPEQRWEAFLRTPANTTHNASGAFEAMVFMGHLLQRQLDQAPQLRATRLPVWLDNRQSASLQAHAAHALLRSGFTLQDFEGDLVGETLRCASVALRRGENPSEALNLLWNEVVGHLHKEAPDRLATLPAELTSAGASLKLLDRLRSVEERTAFCDMLDMQLATPQSSAAPSRPRL